MNAQDKTKILREYGYKLRVEENGVRTWHLNGEIIAQHRVPYTATSEAYKHLLETQPEAKNVTVGTIIHKRRMKRGRPDFEDTASFANSERAKDLAQKLRLTSENDNIPNLVQRQDEELDENSVISNFAITADDGKTPANEPTIEQRINDFARIASELTGEITKPLYARIEELENENAILNRKLTLSQQYVGYLQAALEEIGGLSSVSLKIARVKKIVARALGATDEANATLKQDESLFDICLANDMKLRNRTWEQVEQWLNTHRAQLIDLENGWSIQDSATLDYMGVLIHAVSQITLDQKQIDYLARMVDKKNPEQFSQDAMYGVPAWLKKVLKRTTADKSGMENFVLADYYNTASNRVAIDERRRMIGLKG